MRERTQAQAEGDARSGSQQAQAQGFVVGQQRGGGHVQCALLPEAQRTGSVAESAADPDVIANLCAIAAQCLAARHLPHGGDRQRQRATRGVTTDQRDVVLVGQCEETIGERVDPVFAGFRQRKCKRAPRRARAHCGEVGQVYGQRLPADVECRGFGREVHAAVERIGGDHQLFVRAWLQQCGVVANTEHDVVALDGAGADAVDEGEFGQGHGVLRRVAWIGGGRGCGRMMPVGWNRLGRVDC